MGMHPSEALYRSVMEAMTQGEVEPFAEALADDVVWHQIGAPDLIGKEAVLASFGDMEGVEFDVEAHDVLANDDHVVGLVEAHIKVGDQEFTYRTAEIAHVEDGKVTERWAFSDDTKAIADFFAQFGA